MYKYYYLLIFSILFYSCSSIALREGLKVRETDDWTAIGRDSGKTHIVFSDKKIEPPFTEVWHFNTDGAFAKDALAVCDGVVFAGCLNGDVYAINLKNGNGLGKVFTKSKTCFANPLILKNTVVLVFSDGNNNLIKGYDFRNGVFIWEKKTDRIISSPVFYNDRVIYSTITGKIFSVNPENGEQKEIYKNSKPFFTSPTVSEGIAYLGDTKGKLLAVDLENGDVKWSYETGGGIYSDVSVKDGKLNWKKNTETKFLGGCTFYNGNVIYAGVNGKICSVNISTGETVWENSRRGTITASPVIQGDKIFIGSFDMYFYCIDANNGDVLWKYYFDDRVRTTAVIWQNYIIVATDDKSIFCFK